MNFYWGLLNHDDAREMCTIHCYTKYDFIFDFFCKMLKKWLMQKSVRIRNRKYKKSIFLKVHEFHLKIKKSMEKINVFLKRHWIDKNLSKVAGHSIFTSISSPLEQKCQYKNKRFFHKRLISSNFNELSIQLKNLTLEINLTFWYLFSLMFLHNWIFTKLYRNMILNFLSTL